MGRSALPLISSAAVSLGLHRAQVLCDDAIDEYFTSAPERSIPTTPLMSIYVRAGTIDSVVRASFHNDQKRESRRE